MPDKPWRHTARAIIVREHRLLVIERWRRDPSGQLLHYFSIPGGAIEDGETPQTALERELSEELTLHLQIGPQVAIERLPQLAQEHHYFVATYVSGEPTLRSDSPEAARQNSDNRYLPRWLDLQSAASMLHLIYQPLLPLIQQIAAGHVPDQPFQLTPDLV